MSSTTVYVPGGSVIPRRTLFRYWQGSLRGSEFTWAVAFVVPYIAVFLAFVVYPVFYGAWMGSVIEDSFNPPHDLCVEISRFLTENERLYSPRTYSENAVVFGVESNFQLHEGLHTQGNRTQDPDKTPFWQVSRRLIDARQPYDVVVLADGELREETLTADDLVRYRNLVLPELVFLTSGQAATLREYVERGGNLLVTGSFAVNLGAGERDAVLRHPRVRVVEDAAAFSTEMFVGGPQLRMHGDADIAFNVQALSDKEAALHFIRYDYDEVIDRVPVLHELSFDLRLGSRPFRMARALSPDGTLGVTLDARGVDHRITLTDVGVYGVVLLQG